MSEKEKIKFHRIELHVVLFIPEVYSRSDCKLSLPTVPFTSQKTRVSSAKQIIFDPISVSMSLSL